MFERRRRRNMVPPNSVFSHEMVELLVLGGLLTMSAALVAIGCVVLLLALLAWLAWLPIRLLLRVLAIPIRLAAAAFLITAGTVVVGASVLAAVLVLVLVATPAVLLGLLAWVMVRRLPRFA